MKNHRPGVRARRPKGLGPVLAFDPLSPFVAIVPVVVAVALLAVPEPALWTLGVTALLLVAVDLRRGPPAAIGVLILAGIIAIALTASAPIERVGPSPVVVQVLGAQWQRNQVLAGARLGGKLGAALSLFLLTGLLAQPQDLLKAMVAHLRLPYRIGYAGVAALSFRERFSAEYRMIQEAHALRGTRAPARFLRPLVRRITAVPALMAGAVRHAERVSMSMDARGFGAHRTRSERSVPRWRLRDTVIVLIGWAVACLIINRYAGAGIIIHDV